MQTRSASRSMTSSRFRTSVGDGGKPRSQTARQVSRQATTSSCCRSWFSARLMTSPRLSLLSVVFPGQARRCIALLVKDHWLAIFRCASDRKLWSVGVAERRSRRASGAFWMHLASSLPNLPYDTRTILVCSFLLLNLNCLPTYHSILLSSFSTHLHFFASFCITSLLCFCLLHKKQQRRRLGSMAMFALLLFSMCSSSCQVGWKEWRVGVTMWHCATLCTICWRLRRDEVLV
jgi:hypothetical protein